MSAAPDSAGTKRPLMSKGQKREFPFLRMSITFQEVFFLPPVEVPSSRLGKNCVTCPLNCQGQRNQQRFARGTKLLPWWHMRGPPFPETRGHLILFARKKRDMLGKWPNLVCYKMFGEPKPHAPIFLSKN